MWRLLLLFIFCSGWMQSLHAFNVTCTGVLQSSSLAFPAANVTLGSNIPNYTVLYSVKSSSVASSSSNCNTLSNEHNLVSYVMTLLAMQSSVPDQVYNGKTHKIFPTTVSGLGVSVINGDLSSRTTNQVTIPAWPATQFEYTTVGSGMGNWFELYLWKIPGEIPATGSLAFTGPALYHLFAPINSTDTISSTTMPNMQGNNRYLTWSILQITGSLNLITGTCNMVNGSRVVNMGEYPSVGNGNSAWVDASFNLDCPKAFGYGGTLSDVRSSSSGSITANSISNNPVRIQIVPRTAVVDANAGILGLDGTGAQGYGIQLAWGDSATQGSGVPAKPVILNSWTLANTLNSAYSASAYAIGASAVSSSADGTIKMAARYVRTSGPTQPGPAKAGVEVIASYQ